MTCNNLPPVEEFVNRSNYFEVLSKDVRASKLLKAVRSLKFSRPPLMYVATEQLAILSEEFGFTANDFPVALFINNPTHTGYLLCTSNLYEIGAFIDSSGVLNVNFNKKKKIKPLGPSLLVNRVQFAKDYEEYYYGFYDPLSDSSFFVSGDNLERFVRSHKLRKSSYYDYITFLTGCLEIEHVATRTGWDGDFFHHPLKSSFVPNHPLLNYVAYENASKQHEIVRNALQEGRLLGAFITLSLSSIFLQLANASGFTIALSGLSGAGKTTYSRFISSLFYKDNTTANITPNALEFLLRDLTGLPVVLDEVGVMGGFKEDKLSQIVFMVSSNAGRRRGRKDLSSSLTTFYNTLIITTEKNEFEDLVRAGVFRRYIEISVENPEDFTLLYTPRDIHMHRGCGAGIDFIKHVEEKLFHFKKLYESFLSDAYSKDLSSFAEIYALSMTTLYYLADFYNIDPSSTASTLEALLQRQASRFNKKKDVVKEFARHFSDLVISECVPVSQAQLNNDEATIKPARVYRNTSDGSYYLTSEGLKLILDKLSVDKNTLLRKLVEASILVPSVHNTYLIRKRMGGLGRVYVYRIVFEDLPVPDDVCPILVGRVESDSEYELEVAL